MTDEQERKHDAEMKALEMIIGALEALDPKARERVLNYMIDLFDLDLEAE